jgi:amylosucrase
MWKRMGTNCQNQPEVHSLLRALRACARVAAPAVIFKAEAIVGPDDLAPYLGVGRNQGRECDLAYQNSLMVQYWSALATRDTRLMTQVLSAFPKKPASTSWGTYIRCHDDIGWAITEEDAEAVGWTGSDHRAYLSMFYTGLFPGSFALGEVFQQNAVTGDSRISGTFASLAGLERALAANDPVAIDMAVARILLGHALILGWDSLPLPRRSRCSTTRPLRDRAAPPTAAGSSAGWTGGAAGGPGRGPVFRGPGTGEVRRRSQRSARRHLSRRRRRPVSHLFARTRRGCSWPSTT